MLKVIVSPGYVDTVEGGDTQQFNATVLGTTAQGVAWSVEPTGNGTITPSGLFTADESATGETTIIATSTKTNTVSGTARIGSIS